MALVLLVAASAVGCRPPRESVEDVESRAQQLREAGDYQGSLSLLRTLLGEIERRADVMPWQVGDVRRQLEAVQFLALHPPASKHDFMVADRMFGSLQRAIDEERYEEAADLAERVLTVRRATLGNDHPEVAEAEALLASALDELAQYDRAGVLFVDALRILRRRPEPADSLLDSVVNDFAVHWDDLGELAKAEALYRWSLTLSRQLWGPTSVEVATALNNLADTLFNQGRLAEAEAKFRESLDIRRAKLGDDDSAVAQSWANLGSPLIELQRLAEAEACLLKALGIHNRSGRRDPIATALVLQNLATLKYRAGDYLSAERYRRDAEALRATTTSPPDAHPARGLINHASILIELGRFDEAAAKLDSALDVLRRTAPLQPDVSWALRNYGDLELRRGSRLKALEKYTRSSEAFEIARDRAGFGSARASFVGSPYPELSSVRLELGLRDAAWVATERYLARTLEDVLVPTRRGTANAANDERREGELRAALEEAEARVVALDKMGDAAATERARAELDSLSSRWIGFRQAFSTTRPLTEGGDFTLRRIQHAIESDEALVGWNIVLAGRPTDSIWGYVIRDRGPVRWERLTVSTAGPDGSLLGTSFRRALSRASLSNIDSAPLFVQRVAPLLRHLDGVTRLVVLPSDDMLGVPIEALGENENALLGDRFVVSYAPSATVFAWFREQKRSSGQHTRRHRPRILAMVDPPHNAEQAAEMERRPAASIVSADATPLDERSLSALRRGAVEGDPEALRRLPRLGATRAEATLLAKFGDEGSEIDVGPQCTEERIRDLAATGRLGGFDLIHFGTHAFVDPSNRERSAIVLSQVGLPSPMDSVLTNAPSIDGLVTVREILADWSLNADLVTLAGCETGLGEKVAGEGFLGMANALLQRGARSALVSLWPVEDEPTGRLIGRFYENLLEGSHPESKAAALSEAKRWLRDLEVRPGERPFRHPFYWAGFILIGDPD